MMLMGVYYLPPVMDSSVYIRREVSLLVSMNGQFEGLNWWDEQQ